MHLLFVLFDFTIVFCFTWDDYVASFCNSPLLYLESLAKTRSPVGTPMGLLLLYGPGGIRTLDLSDANRTLSQQSRFCAHLMHCEKREINVYLPETEYLMFQGQPFREEDYCEAIRIVQAAMNSYDPSVIGYRWDDENPRIQLEPRGQRGYIELRAVRRIQK